MSSSSSPTFPSASTLIAIASPSFISLLLLPYATALAFKLALSLPHPPRSIFHRSYYHRATFALPALSSFLYGVGGLFSLLCIARYAGDGIESSPGRGFTIAQGTMQAMGRFGVIVCLLVLLSTFGPRSNRRSSRAHLAPFTTIVVIFLFVLGLASSALSIYLSVASSTSARSALSVLSIVQPAILLSTLLLILITFVLLSLLFNVAAAISRPDRNRGSFAEDYLASKAAQYGVRPISTSTFPPARLVLHLHYSSTISKITPRIIVVAIMGLVAAGLQLADRLLDRGALDTVHIGLSIGRGICEVVWFGGVMQIFYGLCQPRPKAQRTHPEDDGDDSAPTARFPPSSSGNHLLHARSHDQASNSSPFSRDSHNYESSPSTTAPQTPATPKLPNAPNDGLSAGSTRSRTSGQGHPHDDHGSSAPVTAGSAFTHPENGSNTGLDGGDGLRGRSIARSATVSEEFLYLCGDDPFSSPPPGTMVLPKMPPAGNGIVKKRSGVAVAKAKVEASSTATTAVDAAPKSKVRPKRSSSDEDAPSGVRKGEDEGRPLGSNSGGGPSSKKARTSGDGAHNGGKLSKRSSPKTHFSRRSSTKHRRSGGVDKYKKKDPVEGTNDIATPLTVAPAVAIGTTRPRPPRSPIPRHLRSLDALGQVTSETSGQEESNSLGLIVHDHQPVPGSSTARQDIQQSTSAALGTITAKNDAEGLLRSVVTNALALKRHRQLQYLDPASALLPHAPGVRSDYSIDDREGGVEDRDHRSGSTTPTRQSQEDAGSTPRGGSPSAQADSQPATSQKQFKFTTLVDSSVSTGSESCVPLPDPMIYQRTTLDGPTRPLDPSVTSLESFPRTPSLAGATMSIASLPSASELQNQLTPSPDDRNSFRFTTQPPSSFEASAPIDIPATGARTRNHYRRRAPSASILEAARAMPSVSPLRGGPGGGKLHKPNSTSYDSARARARAIMNGVEVVFHPRANEPVGSHNAGDGTSDATTLLRSTSNPVPGTGPARVESLAHHHQLRPDPSMSVPSPGLPLLNSRFSDPTTTGTGSSGGTTSSTGGFDAASESSFK